MPACSSFTPFYDDDECGRGQPMTVPWSSDFPFRIAQIKGPDDWGIWFFFSCFAFAFAFAFAHPITNSSRVHLILCTHFYAEKYVQHRLALISLQKQNKSIAA